MAVKEQRIVVPPETQCKKWFNFGKKMVLSHPSEVEYDVPI
jgi:hypothetical protein